MLCERGRERDVSARAASWTRERIHAFKSARLASVVFSKCSLPIVGRRGDWVRPWSLDESVS